MVNALLLSECDRILASQRQKDYAEWNLAEARRAEAQRDVLQVGPLTRRSLAYARTPARSRLRTRTRDVLMLAPRDHASTPTCTRASAQPDVQASLGSRSDPHARRAHPTEIYLIPR